MWVSHAKGWFLVLLIEQHCRDGVTHTEGNSDLDPFKIPPDELDFLLYSPNRRRWSFAFTHASTSSKCILSALRCLSQFGLSFRERIGRLPIQTPGDVNWIVTEMIDWLKVHDPNLIKEIYRNPDIWEEPNSRSSTTGSAHCLDGRCTQENRRGDSDSEAEGY